MKIIEISTLDENVFAAVSRLLPQLFSAGELPSRQYLESALSSENIHLFVAELANKEIAGMFTLATCPIPSGLKIWIEDVVVDEAHRGEGLGRELMLHAIEYSKSLGAKTIELTSRPARIAANKLYQSLGFVHYETNVYKYQFNSTSNR
jgi:ribosomal protein S18 acetylase RimI-like enzyme